MKKKKALTLVEVIVGIAIFAITILSFYTLCAGMQKFIIKQRENIYFENVCRDVSKYGKRYNVQWDEEYFGRDITPVTIDGVEIYRVYFDSRFQPTEDEGKYLMSYYYDADGNMILSVENCDKNYKIIDSLNYGGNADAP